MQKYVYQKFLLDRDYESVDLQKHVLTVSNETQNQQDFNFISLSTLDCTVDLKRIASDSQSGVVPLWM